MKTRTFFLTLIVLAAFSACGDSDTTAKRYANMATGFCECTNQLAALNKEAVSLANDTTGRAATIIRQMQAEYDKAKECSATIVAQYGKLKPEEFAAVQNALAGKCPDLTEQRDLLQEMLGE